MRVARRPADPDREVLERVTYPADCPPARLDQVVCASFAALPTRASARKACRRSEITVDGEISEPSRWVDPGAEICRLEPARPPPPLAIPIQVVYEDDWLAVVHKPAGLPSSGPTSRTLERALPANLVPSAQPDALAAPRVVHRLDAPTSGLLLTAKTRSAHAALGAAFRERRIEKRYLAIIVGELRGDAVIDADLDGRPAITRCHAIEQTRSLHIGWLTTVALSPETGRTHQIRRHLASIGHPVLGDGTYDQSGRVLLGNGLFLAAVALGFLHPATGAPVHLSIREPDKFGAFRSREARRWQRARGLER